MAAAHAGNVPDQEELLRRYPELSAQLQTFFADNCTDKAATETEPIGVATEPALLNKISAEDWASLASQKRNPPQTHHQVADASTFLPDGYSVLARPRGTMILMSSRTAGRCFGDYELLKEIVRGGMEIVYKARQLNLNRIDALKMILTDLLPGKDHFRRFHLELETVPDPDHPALLPVFAVGNHNRPHYFSISIIEGQNLTARFDRRTTLATHNTADYTRRRRSRSPRAGIDPSQLETGPWCAEQRSSAKNHQLRSGHPGQH